MMVFLRKFLGLQSGNTSRERRTQQAPEETYGKRREQVERDKVFYCEGCGKRGAHRGSGDGGQTSWTFPPMIGQACDRGPAVCCHACVELFYTAQKNQLFGSAKIIGKASDAMQALVRDAQSGDARTYCRWCGAPMGELANVCPRCAGPLSW
jgi:hypothetical protein